MPSLISRLSIFCTILFVLQATKAGVGMRLENPYMNSLFLICKRSVHKVHTKTGSCRAWSSCTYPFMLQRMGMAIKNLWSMIFVSVKCSAQPIHEKFVPPLYRNLKEGLGLLLGLKPVFMGNGVLIMCMGY